MIPAALLEQTFARFPEFSRRENVAKIRIEPLEKGGSDRKYYRILAGERESLILVKYGTQRDENRHYCDIAAFLTALGIRVPRIYHHDPEESLIWMEDLGAHDLWSFREAPWPERRRLWGMALGQAVRLHSRTALPRPGDERGPRFQIAFDAELYRWEQDYFFENCAGRVFGVQPGTLETSAFAGIADRLAALPRTLVHRDFQSQNILIQPGENGDEACLIDFQGMRPGLPQYDLASLLYDPYVTFSDDERRTLFADAVSLYNQESMPLSDDFHEVYHFCALQRLMQALGAYGFLGLIKNHPHFLRHIPAALGSLRGVAAQIPGLENFRRLLERLGNEVETNALLR